jgi:hypothetical protein
MNDVLVNTMRAGAGQDFEYATVPAGLRLMGLVRIENAIIKANPKFGGGDDKEGYKFLFQDYEVPDGFVSIRATSTLSPNSTLTKLLRNMTGGKLTEGDRENPARAFEIMASLPGHWFQVMVSNRMDKDGNKWANIEGQAVAPAPFEQVKSLDLATRRYEMWKAAKQQGRAMPGMQNGPSGFEGYPDGALAQPAPAAPTAPVQALPGFWYQVILSQDQSVMAKQLAFLNAHGAVRQGDTNFWNCQKDIPELKDKKVDPSTVFFKGDDVPF